MRDKIFTFFDSLAGYYEDITGKSANDLGKLYIVVGPTTMLAGDMLFLSTGEILYSIVAILVHSIFAIYAHFLYTKTTPMIMRGILSSTGDKLLILVVFQIFIIFLPGSSGYWEDTSLNISIAGYAIFIIGQFLYGSNPTPPKKRFLQATV